jgi:predicted nucleotidyltransferase
VSTAQAARDLAEFADTSVVLRDVVGRSYSWRLNSSHVLFTALVDLFAREAGLRSDLMHELSEELRPVRPERARLFGSITRGEERPDSDVDLFLQIRTPDQRQEIDEAVQRIRSRVWNRFGNPVSVLVYSRAEVARPRNPALLESIEREGMDVGGGEG